MTHLNAARGSDTRAPAASDCPRVPLTHASDALLGAISVAAESAPFA
jgi:hypothetical protein